MEKQKLLWVLEVVLLHNDGKDLTSMISQIPNKYIILGKKVLEFIENEM